MRGVGGEINRNRMARVGAGRSSEAEKKDISWRGRRHNDSDGETFDSCALRLESWHRRAYGF